ncbi:MAG TPA: hypothetical protein VIV12_23545 [Streptosporangiaceae bacterium]
MTTTRRPRATDGLLPTETPEPEPEPEQPTPEPEPDQDPDTPTLAEIAQALTRGVDVPEIEPEAMAAALVGRVMGLDDKADVLVPITPTTASLVTERPLQITDYQLRKSYYLDGLGVYLLIDAVDLSTGEVLLIMCGATNVVAQVLRAADLGALGVPVKFEQRTSQANPDRTLLWLRPYDQPPVP